MRAMAGYGHNRRTDVALTKAAERELKRLFREREPRKTYIACVYGHPTCNKGNIDLQLIPTSLIGRGKRSVSARVKRS